MAMKPDRQKVTQDAVPQNPILSPPRSRNRSFVDEGITELSPPLRPSNRSRRRDQETRSSLGNPKLMPPQRPQRDENSETSPDDPKKGDIELLHYPTATKKRAGKKEPENEQNIPEEFPLEFAREHADTSESKKEHRMKKKKVAHRQARGSQTRVAISSLSDPHSSPARYVGYHEEAPSVAEHGAFAVAGPGVTQHHDVAQVGAPGSGSYRRSYDSASVGLENPQHGESNEILLNAVLVSEEPPTTVVTTESPASALPAFVKATPINKRRQRILTVLLIVVTIGSVLGLVLGLTLRPDDEDDRVLLTVTFQLDSNPEETGWTLLCSNDTIADFPPGTFKIPNQNGSALAEVVDQDVCSLTVVDTGSDGIDDGFFQVFLGNAIEQDDSQVVLLAFLSGDFSSETSATFVADSALLEETGPTQVPTQNPDLFPPSVAPTAQLNQTATFTPTVEITSNPTFVPTLDPTSSPTLNPTVEPTFIPTVAPTFVPTLNPTSSPTLNPMVTTSTVPSTSAPPITPTQGAPVTPEVPTISPTPEEPSEPTFSPVTTGFPTGEPTAGAPSEPTFAPVPLPVPPPQGQTDSPTTGFL